MKTPFELFEESWYRCDEIEALHSYLAKNLSSVLNPDELLRAEWVARVSALDLFIHELIAQKAQLNFAVSAIPTKAYLKLRVPMATVHGLMGSADRTAQASTLDLQLRTQLSLNSYQAPDAIADGIRVISDVEMWKNVALELGTEQNLASDKAKEIKKKLSLIVSRRNKIAHEGDVAPSATREPWPIDVGQLLEVRTFVRNITLAINKIIW